MCMRFVGVLLLFLLFIIATSLHAQSNDTAKKAAESTRNAVRQPAKIIRLQDSVQAERIIRQVQKNGKPLDAFLQERREKEKARKRQQYLRIGLGAAFLIVLALILARRRKKA